MMGKKYKTLGILFFVLVLFSGCYKQELDEFQKISFKNERDLAFPLFESTLTLKDSLPFEIPTLTLADTIKTNLSFSSFIKDYSGKMDYVEFKVGVKTNFPITGSVQIYFANDQGQIMDSLFTYENILLEGAMGENYNETVISSYMDHEKYAKIKTSSKLYIRYNLNTFASSSYASNEIQIKSGIRFGMTF